MIHASSIEEAWKQIVNTVIRYGDPVENVIQLRYPETIEIDTSLTPDIPPQYNMGKSSVIGYVKQFKNPHNTEFEYTYGERLFGYNGYINQFDVIYNRLNDNINSRRALAALYKPSVDAQSNSIPCLQFMQYNIYDEELRLTSLFRSHDVLQAFPANVFAMWTVSEELANKLNVKFTRMYVISNNAHVYVDRDVDLLKVVKL